MELVCPRPNQRLVVGGSAHEVDSPRSLSRSAGRQRHWLIANGTGATPDLRVCTFSSQGPVANEIRIRSNDTGLGELVHKMNNSKSPYVIGVTEPHAGTTVWLCPTLQSPVREPESQSVAEKQKILKEKAKNVKKLQK